MTYMVPFDGSELSRAATAWATEYGASLEIEVMAVTVIPNDRRYARQKGWIGTDAEFDHATIAANLHRDIVNINPNARHETMRTDPDLDSATLGEILGGWAAEINAEAVFIGVDSVGRLLEAMIRADRHVASMNEDGGFGIGFFGDWSYDLHVVRRSRPPKGAVLAEESTFNYPE